MIAYKGFDRDRRGYGGFQFEPDIWYKEPECKTVRNGFHCTEYPLACMQYFQIGEGTQYWQVEAQGEIDEDEWRIACTEIRLIKQLNLKEMAYYGIQYMVNHPKRTDWELSQRRLRVKREFAEAEWEGEGIVIARGEDPAVSGSKGTICGLIREINGEIIGAGMFVAGGNKYEANRMYGMTKDGEIY